MKKLQFLIIFITFSFLFISPTLAQVSDSIYHQRLYHLCKIWGFVKYHHSEIANGNVNWDDELINRIPGIKSAPNNQAFNDSLLLFINSAGETSIGEGEIPEVPDSLNLIKDWTWMSDEVLSMEVQDKLNYIKEQFRPMLHVKIGQDSISKKTIFKDHGYNNISYYPEEEVRALALYRYWNCINYYFPYKLIMDKKWDTTLVESIPNIIQAANKDEYHLAIKELSVKINDSHSYMESAVYRRIRGIIYTTFSTKYIDGQMVVDKVLEIEENIKLGDIVLEVDNVNTQLLRDSLLRYASGSNNISVETDLSNILLWGQEDAIIKVTNGIDTNTYEVDRSGYHQGNLGSMYHTEIWYDTIINNNCNMGIVDMGRLEVEDVSMMFDDFKNKDVIVFDMRNYPRYTLWEMVNYLYPGPIHIANFNIPDITHPGQLIVDSEEIGYGSDQPYSGKIILLFNEATISQAEYTIMGFEQHPNSIKIGSTTQGADGDVTSIRIPGRIILYHTGLGVFYPNFTPTQRVGIIPDYYVRPTIEGIRAGKDEVLEFALNCSLGTDELNTEFDISIFPNPTDGLINYEFQGQNFVPKSTIRLTNVNGQIVYDKTICDFKGEISTTHLPAGVYLLSIFNEEFRTTEKIIVN